MIRAYFVQWQAVPLSGGQIYCLNEILEHIDTYNNLNIATRLYWPKEDAILTLKHPIALTVVWGNDFTSALAQELANLSTVQMLPIYTLDTLIADIPAGVINSVKTYLSNQGIPLSIFSGMVNYFDFIQKLAFYFNADHDLNEWLARKVEFG